MGELKIVDEVPSPSGILEIKYKGTNTFKAMAVAPKVLRAVMKIPGKDLFEFDVRWDTSVDPREFYGVWMGKRTEDRWTATKIKIFIQGNQGVKDKFGYVRIELRGHLETNYKFSNFIQRSFWWFYNYGFYYGQRRRYLDFARDNMQELKENFQQVLGIAKH
ncbi:hypothetical protein ACFLQN_04505 [Candidatus Aenigmatarchaeota archaeon]